VEPQKKWERIFQFLKTNKMNSSFSNTYPNLHIIIFQ
jgi:hypothetical protein